MCGRDTEFFTWKDVHAFSQPLTVAVPGEDPAPAYNHAPTQPAWVLVAAQGAVDAVAESMRWGLLPPWAREPKLAFSTINARVETAASKPSFRAAWKHRRCLVPASGYYEWQVLPDGRKQPWFIHDAHAPVLMFAGLWERWQREGDAILSYAIVTRAAEGPITAVHDRMPLCLTQPLMRDWLHGNAADATRIAATAPLPDLAFHRVSPRVNQARNQGADLIAPIAA